MKEKMIIKWTYKIQNFYFLEGTCKRIKTSHRLGKIYFANNISDKG